MPKSSKTNSLIWWGENDTSFQSKHKASRSADAFNAKKQEKLSQSRCVRFLRYSFFHRMCQNVCVWVANSCIFIWCLFELNQGCTIHSNVRIDFDVSSAFNRQQPAYRFVSSINSMFWWRKNQEMFEEVFNEICNLLPPIGYVENVLRDHSLERSINQNFYKIVSCDRAAIDDKRIQDALIMADACRDRLWEIINTGHFSKVSRIDRQLYTLATLQKTVLRVLSASSESIAFETVIEQCIWDMDNGLLLGCPFDHPKYAGILSDCLNLLQRHTNSECDERGPLFDSGEQCMRPSTKVDKSDVIVLNSPSVQEFRENHFDKLQPAILTGCMNHWPALLKWIEPQYLVRIANHRIVPIEVGSSYTKETWSQDMVKFQDFFRRQLVDDAQSTDRIEYLAQHNLFDQIPALKDDILVPDYCCISNQTDASETDIKAWLGPKGTISPMHHDPKHNLLCQVFGYKRIILAAPADSCNLYPFEGNLLGNTSQIDAEHLDVDAFPLVEKVKFYRITLYRGEMLYIPPKWWHYVKALSKSFSVSFWWE